MNKKVKVLIADDHSVVRQGIISMLQSRNNIEVIGEAENGFEVKEKSCSLVPDVLLIDIAMPELNGLEAIKLVKEIMPNIAIVILSMYDNDTYIKQAFKAGVLGYVLKASPAFEIYEAIHAAYRGKTYLSEDIREKVVAGYVNQGTTKPEINRYESLTPQEKQVFLLLVQGGTIKEIADQLFVSPKTIEKHRTAISHKLGIKNRIGMTYFAIKNELINIDLMNY
jgi:two-component system response regulator NreC